jgi:Uma2 family endonuclease
MGLPQEQLYTIEDIYRLPDGKRAELIDGQIYMMSPPSRRHQQLSSLLSRRIGNYIEAKGGTCEVYSAPFAVFLTEHGTTYVEPDISVICNPLKLTDRGCKGAPDWIIEIVSPSSKQMDYVTKLIKYATSGVREYWIVDPIRNRILVYALESEQMEEYTFQDKIKVNIYDDLEIDFSEINLT